jgi:histidine ammonia-lyase
MLVLNDRSDFTLDAYRRAAWEGEHVELSQSALERIGEMRSSLERLVANNPDRHYYGTTTTPGEGVKTVLTPEQRRAYLDRGVHTWTFGDPVPQRVARGFVFTRLITFIEGYAGVRPVLAEAVAEYLDGRELTVPSRGHSWEIGVPGALYQGLQDRVGGFEMKETMALSNGCPAGTALVCDLALAGRARAELALHAMALGAEALLAPHEHYAEELGELWVDRHEAAVMARMRELMDGGSSERRPFQAPVSFRIIPRMVGIVYRSQELAESAAATMLRAVSDNPVYVPPAEGRPDGDIWSTGGYHPAQAIHAMDNLAYGWANLCQQAYHQGTRLQSDEYGLGAESQFQGGRTGGAMANAAWAYEMAQLAQPTLLPLTGSGQTDAGSMSFAAWRKATEIGCGLDAMLAGISVTASEIFDLSGRPVPPALEDYLAFVRSYREPNGSRQTIGSDLGALADAITGRVYGAEVAVSG